MRMRKQVAVVVMCIVLVPEAGFSADLSPARWKAEEKAQAEQAEQMPWPLQARVVQGQQGLVAGTMSPIAVHAGIEALRQGGTAADAAATVALTQIATALGSYVSYAGIMELVYYDAKSGKVTTMNAGWNSYLGDRPKEHSGDGPGGAELWQNTNRRRGRTQDACAGIHGGNGADSQALWAAEVQRAVCAGDMVCGEWRDDLADAGSVFQDAGKVPFADG